MFHREAFREILLNAVVHKDYSSCNPIQISVYEDKMYIWNDGKMPENLNTVEKLFAKHSSKPFNPNLANVFFKSGMIEAWGRGFDKITEACNKYGAPLPDYDINADGIMVLCKPSYKYIRLLKNEDNLLGQNEQENESIIMAFCVEPKSVKEITDEFNMERTYLRRHYLDRMLNDGRLHMTIPDKPNSRNQKYYS